LLRDLIRELLHAARVVAPLEELDGRSAHVAGVGIGDEPFGAVAGPDEAVASAARVGLFRHYEDDHAGIARRIARLAEFADLPRASDLQRDVLFVVLANVRQRHDDDLAAGL